jgi:hypothetical protein
MSRQLLRYQVPSHEHAGESVSGQAAGGNMHQPDVVGPQSVE